ncbi:B12-binding domain-containing protein [Actinoplanes sp. CA-051413]|uniref:B12-binding domain-containing protein n=1 Tax=Actinoplanes sp. CA-051413 TaxID=3239899 RepID=UPI003D97603D
MAAERPDQLSDAETSRDAVQPDHDGTAAEKTSGAAENGPTRSAQQRRDGIRPDDWSGDPGYPTADRFDLAGAASDEGDTFFRVGEQPPTVDAVWPEQLGQMFVARDGGGHAIRTGRAGPVARGLARAAMRLDGPALRDILEMTVTDRGVVAAWEEVIMPVLIGVGERYAATKRFIEVEHILSRVVTEVLGSVTRPPSSQIPRVLLAAADEEQHTLPLEALAAALAQAGVSSRLLGARVPAQAVADAVARTGPAVLVLWSQLAGSADPAQWHLVLAGRHRPLLAAAAGPGWLPEQLPAGVTLLGNLTEAVQLVSAVALPANRPR